MPRSQSRISRSQLNRFGLVAELEAKRVVLPLKGVECFFTTSAGVVEVSMTQIFRQENPRPLDCRYLFPLPADASVYSCEADINGRIIRACVRERGEAVELAAKHKAEGHRTALVESERDNLFTLSLANLQPGDLIIVSLKYIQPLRRLDDALSVEIPFCPGVRYIPGKPLLRQNQGTGVEDDTNQVPDASRITSARIDAGHPDAAFIEIRGDILNPFVDAESLQSPSHVILACPGEAGVRVMLADKGDVPDRNFVLRWHENKPRKVVPRAWTKEQEGETYALVELRAPEHLSGNPAPLDFYFLVDRSGSMGGDKWTKAVQALQSSIKLLGPDDRVMITLFESAFQDFAEAPLPPGRLLKDKNFQCLERLGVTGGTEMAPALEHVVQLADRLSAKRAKNLILITDAQVGNDQQILALLAKAKDLPIHCIGIDVALNDALLQAMTRQQGGTFHSLNPNEDIERAVTSLARTLRLPVLTNLRAPAGWELAGGRLPNLYAGQVLHASAKSRAERRWKFPPPAPMERL